MSAATSGAAAAAAVHAANLEAAKAIGTVVRVEPPVLADLLRRAERPVVVVAETSGFFSGRSYQYLLPYRGLTFYAKSPIPLDLPREAEVIRAGRVAVPNL